MNITHLERLQRRGAACIVWPKQPPNVETKTEMQQQKQKKKEERTVQNRTNKRELARANATHC